MARGGVAYVLVLVAALLAPVAILGTWTQRHIVDTQGYVDAVAPLSSDVHVQQAVIDAVTDAVVRAVPTKQLLATLPPSLAGSGKVTQALARGVVRGSVTEIVQGPTFPDLWASANRAAQTQVLAELRAASDPGTASNARLAIDLDPIAEAVRVQLVGTGFTALQNVRFSLSGDHAVVLTPTGDLGRAGRWWSRFESATHWLWPVVLLLAAAALVIAPHRRRVLLVEALALLASIGLAAILTARGHHAFGQQFQGGSAGSVAQAIGDVLARSLAHWLRVFAVVAAATAVAAVAALALPSRPPRLTP